MTALPASILGADGNFITTNQSLPSVSLSPEMQSRIEKLENKRLELEISLQEQMLESAEFLHHFVDPTEAFRFQDTGQFGVVVGGDGDPLPFGFHSEQDLIDTRHRSRENFMNNEFAINGIENRINFVIGTGHTYRAVAKKSVDVSDNVLQQVQDAIDEFIEVNEWDNRQEETQRRADRDGEAFRRFFDDGTGTMLMRFVEPGLIRDPSGDPDSNKSFGIVTDPMDVETVLGYILKKEGFIEANEIQHIKCNVDSNVKRGLPLYHSVYNNLERAEKLLRNMSALAAIQSSIAMIRKTGSDSNTLRNFAEGKKDFAHTNTQTGKRHLFEYQAPGRILNATANLTYEFPSMNVNASALVEILQAELRAIASRLNMPEFMLSADASNNNRASIVVAGDPFVRTVQRLQQKMITPDKKVMWRAVGVSKRVTQDVDTLRQAIQIAVTAPTIAVRNRGEETVASEVEFQNGLLSMQTWTAETGRDFETEQGNIKKFFDDLDPALREMLERRISGRRNGASENVPQTAV